MNRFLRPFAVGLLLTACAFGCGKKELPRAAVSGKVTYNGKLVPQGTVSMISDDGESVESGPIQGGVYKVARAPIGKVKVGVITPTAGGAQQQMKQKVEGKTLEAGAAEKEVPVPTKYAKPDSSGLTLTIPAEGSQALDIEIKEGR